MDDDGSFASDLLNVLFPDVPDDGYLVLVRRGDTWFKVKGTPTVVERAGVAEALLRRTDGAA